MELSKAIASKGGKSGVKILEEGLKKKMYILTNTADQLYHPA